MDKKDSTSSPRVPAPGASELVRNHVRSPWHTEPVKGTQPRDPQLPAPYPDLLDLASAQPSPKTLEGQLLASAGLLFAALGAWVQGQASALTPPISHGPSISQTMDPKVPRVEPFPPGQPTDPRVAQQIAAIRGSLEKPIDTLHDLSLRLEELGKTLQELADSIKDAIEQREKQREAAFASPPTLAQGPPPDPPRE